MLGDELNALVVAVCGNAFEKAASAVSIGFGKCGTDCERRQAREGFNIVGSLHRVVEIFAKKRQTDATDQADNESESDIAGLRWTRRVRRNHRRIDDADVG